MIHEPLPDIELFDRCIVKIDGKAIFDHDAAFKAGQITIEEYMIIFRFRRDREMWVNHAVRWMAISEIAKRKHDEIGELRNLMRAEEVFEAYGRPNPRWLAKAIAREVETIDRIDRQFDDSDFVGPQHPDMWPQRVVRMARHVMRHDRLAIRTAKSMGMPALNHPAWIR